MGRLTAIVLGAAAGGGFPQWNCRCPVCRLAWAGDTRVQPRTQASLAVSTDGEPWILLNASPDLRAQVQATPALQPRAGTRDTPIAASLVLSSNAAAPDAVAAHFAEISDMGKAKALEGAFQQTQKYVGQAAARTGIKL